MIVQNGFQSTHSDQRAAEFSPTIKPTDIKDCDVETVTIIQATLLVS